MLRKLLKRLFNTAAKRYTTTGLGFGLMFPIIATAIAIAVGQLPLSLSSAASVQGSNQLLWIIDTAPLFLGLLAYFAGQRQDVLQATYTQLQQVTTQLRQQEQTTAVELDRRTEQLRASADVGRAAASMLDPDKLLNDVVNLIASRFNFYYAAIFLIDSNNEFAVLREATGETGRQLKERNHKLPINGTSMVSTAITTRRPRIALDVGEERIRFANPLLPNTRSEIALPLIAGDRVFGALDVQSTQEAAFDKPGAEVLQTMADQIAVALNNATTLIDMQAKAQRAKLTATLLSNAFELTTQSDRQTLYDRIIQLAMELINADGAGLALPVSDTELEFKASFEVGPNPRQMLGRRLRIGEDVSGRVFESKQSLRIENYTTWTGRASSFTDASYHAILGIPLLWQNKVVAVLTLTHSQPNRSFSPEDEQSMNLLASQATASLVNADLREAQERTLAELDVLNRRLTGEVWTSFTKQLKHEGADWIGVGEPIERADLPEVAEALATGQIATQQRLNAGLTNVAIPIVLRGTSIGVMRLRVPPESWSMSAATTLTSIAGHIAQSVENARLLDQTSRTAQREKDIALAADRIHRASDLEDVLRTTIDEVRRITGMAEVGIQIGADANKVANA